MSTNTSDIPVVLSVAGSDSGGGSGIQADLKTFSALDVFGTTSVTCVTAQSPDQVVSIVAMEPDMVRQQIRTVCESFPVAAAKTGMLYSSEIINAVAAADIRQGIPVLVVDPVMVAASGSRLLQADAVETLCNRLLPEARVVTPNLHEAEILWGQPISNLEEMKKAARHIGDRYDVACVVKGGHLKGPKVTDLLYDAGELFEFSAPRIHVAQTHGAGCAFSAALTSFLARKELMRDAVSHAKDFVYASLDQALSVGKHTPLNFRADLWGCTQP